MSARRPLDHAGLGGRSGRADVDRFSRRPLVSARERVRALRAWWRFGWRRFQSRHHVSAEPAIRPRARDRVCAGVALVCAHRWREALTPQEKPLFAVLAVGINILLLAGLTSEVELYYDTARLETQTFVRNRLAESLTVSLLWTAYAAGLVLLGVRFSSAVLRWQALALFALTSLKVFFADLAYLRGFYRIVSSIALGIVLLIISYLYQRRLSSAHESGTVERA